MNPDARHSRGDALKEACLFDWLAFAGAIVLVRFSSTLLNDVLIWTVAAYAILRHRTGLVRPWTGWPAAGFALYGIVLLLTLPLSLDVRASAGDMAKIATPFMLAFVAPTLVTSSRTTQRLLRAYALAITAIVACDEIRLGMQCGARVFSLARFHEPYLLNHPNVASMMAGIAFFILLLPILAGENRRASLAWIIPAMAANLAYIVLMASRGPQAAFVVALVLAGLWWRGWRRKVVWFLACAGALLLVAHNLERVNPRFLERRSMKTLSERTTVWRHTLRLANERPWIGHGYGKRTFVQTYYSSKPPRSSFHFPHCHQYWLAIYFQKGLIGLGLAAGAWVLLAAALIRRACASATPPDARPVIGTALVLMAFLHVYGMGDYPDSVVRYSMMWLAGIGVAIAAQRTAAAPGTPEP